MKKKRIVILHLNKTIEALSKLRQDVELVHITKSGTDIAKTCLDADGLLVVGSDFDYTGAAKYVVETLSNINPEMIIGNVSIVTGAKSEVKYQGEILHVYPNDTETKQRLFLESLLSKISAGKSQ